MRAGDPTREFFRHARLTQACRLLSPPKRLLNHRQQSLNHRKLPLIHRKLPLALPRFRTTLPIRSAENGGRSSTVESQIVILVVAGSSPVGHPTSLETGEEDRIGHTGQGQEGTGNMGDHTASLEARLGYTFRQQSLLKEALTHPSIAHNKQKKRDATESTDGEAVRSGFHFQRLEHLGDAVVQLAISETLFEQFPKDDEGLLTKLRTRAVQTGTMARLARQLELGPHLVLGRGEESSGGRDRDKILADALEAIIGAVHLDSNYDVSRQLVLRLWASELAALRAAPVEQNPKGQLQELLQNHGGETPSYRIISSDGPSHARTFLVQVAWNGTDLATGSGRSKQEAEIAAAQRALSLPDLQQIIAQKTHSQPCEQPCEDHSSNSATVRTDAFHN